MRFYLKNTFVYLPPSSSPQKRFFGQAAGTIQLSLGHEDRARLAWDYHCPRYCCSNVAGINNDRA